MHCAAVLRRDCTASSVSVPPPLVLVVAPVDHMTERERERECEREISLVGVVTVVYATQAMASSTAAVPAVVVDNDDVGGGSIA